MTDHRVRTEIEGDVAILTLDRPEKLNAIDGAMIAAIEAWVETVEADRGVRAAILTGAGSKAFSAGGDIEAWAGLDPIDFARRWIREGHRVFDRLARLRQPLIVALNGHTFGGGLELAVTGDLIIASAGARLGLPETGLGMTPGWAGTQRLVRRCGSRMVKRMALAGRILSAEEALEGVVVDEVVAAGEALARAKAIAADVAARGPVAVQIVKQLVNAAEGEEREAAMESLAGAFVGFTEDLKEGVASFREKRRPRFAGR
ncbi:MAG: enoyl-CoA hydratase [Rhodospirillaceae bacterium]|nr:enoyl-CoA hydratase [Rhodospirillaceae bacterium]